MAMKITTVISSILFIVVLFADGLNLLDLEFEETLFGFSVGAAVVITLVLLDRPDPDNVVPCKGR